MQYSVDYFSAIVESAMAAIEYPSTARRLFEPIKYTLESGGKRLRPVLLLSVFSALSRREPSEAINQALAVEMFHNFTLLHDDVMDNADLRRGRPTVHRRWNENAAILSGDTMLTMASQLLAMCPPEKLPELCRVFNDTAIGVYQGQQLDMEFERRNDVSVSEYLEMIKLKTSVLLAGACALGAVMAGASEADRTHLYNYGLALGIAFQLRDDWLDTYGDPAIFGKEIGGDIINRKKTLLLITGLEESDGELAAIMEEDLVPNERVEQVRRLFDSLGLSERLGRLAAEYSAKAVEELAKVEMDNDARKFFESLAVKAATRTH